MADKIKTISPIGQRFDDFLEVDGIQTETYLIAIKRVIAWQIEQAMKKQKISKRALAARLKTSRSQIDRVLDPTQCSIQLDTLANVAREIGHELRFEIREKVAS